MIGKRLGEVKNLMVKNHSASSRFNCWDKISFLAMYSFVKVDIFMMSYLKNKYLQFLTFGQPDMCICLCAISLQSVVGNAVF